MLLRVIADSFPATFGVLLALMYADYALTVLGLQSYVKYGRAYQVFEQYELNPFWREAVGEGRYWHKRVWALVLLALVFSGLVWLIGWSARLTSAEPDPMVLAVRDGLLAMLLSFYLLIIATHLRSIVAFRLLGGGGASGQITFSPGYTYASTRAHYAVLALPLIALAVLQPSAATIGFAIGPLLLVRVLSRMERKSRRLAAATQPPSAELSPDSNTGDTP